MRAMLAPIPDAPPVITATLSSSLIHSSRYDPCPRVYDVAFP
jgi:hypothetical protein